MLRALVTFSLRFRGIIVALACVLVGYGIYVAQNSKLDVFPNFVQPQVGLCYQHTRRWLRWRRPPGGLWYWFTGSLELHCVRSCIIARPGAGIGCTLE